MFIDAKNIPAQHVVKTNICIIGGGPVGIAIAKELMGQPFDVLLVESGSSQYEMDTQSLADGETEGDPYASPLYTRVRMIGGTANSWHIDMDGRYGVRYVPLDPIDFEKRSWVPHSGWPINRTTLDPYYVRAQALAQSGPFDYNPESWEDETAKALPFTGNRLTSQVFQFGPSDVFLETLRKEIEDSKNVTLMIYANALELETNESAQTVTGVKIGVLGGKTFRIEADQVILANGGMETARLLLLSNARQKAGLGNQNDVVGRYFMDHPIVMPGLVIPKDRSIMNKVSFYDTRWVNGARVVAKPVLTEDVMEKERLLNMNAALFPRPGWLRHNLIRKLYPKGLRRDSPSVQSMEALRALLRPGKKDADFANISHQNSQSTAGASSGSVPQHLWNVATGTGDLAYLLWRRMIRKRYYGLPLCGYNLDHGGWSKLDNKPGKFGMFDVLHITEQAPDPENRILLSNDCDVFGYRKMRVCWKYNELDRHSIRRGMEIFGEEFEKVGLGHLKLDLDYGSPQILFASIHHPMGATRMHEDPKRGVVNANCQVHGVSNLYIASSSVFPTGGYANPTLTILALAIRIADRVKGVMKPA